ncbi:MarR family winged helix-turn-helix transcriptional regulator [Neobacillus terrae]|uniref:MarR family winged helix-turn-helix transcriptional regulator n=1 Tax=Neobacillus terrae TaxID=3034837 RepID=UPI00140DEE5C|nr:winged helix DNA-binding protein [Neobacillus terrae]NHM33038.1 MarR family transcriptional regulator [Neobacillus terrae]
MQGFFQRFLMLYRPLISKLNELLDDYDLSYSLWQVIFYVKNNGPSTLVDISGHYNIEKPTITRNVQRLQEKLLLEVVPGKDKREKIIKLTSRGEEIYKACREKITELEYKVMMDITKEEQTAAFDVLPKIRKNLINIEGGKHE